MKDELVKLDSVYQEPGFLLLATDDEGKRLGCVGARAIDAESCEVRRMFVRHQGRRLGVGRALAITLQAEATSAGFGRLVLNTLPAMTEAISLYESMGFNRCVPYVGEPLDGVLYYALPLQTGP